MDKWQSNNWNTEKIRALLKLEPCIILKFILISSNIEPQYANKFICPTLKERYLSSSSGALTISFVEEEKMGKSSY